MTLLPYKNTIAELNAAKFRLKKLQDRKSLLMHKYCDPKSTTYDKEVSFGGGDGKSGQERYILAISEPSEATGMSIDEEINTLSQSIKMLQDDLKTIQQMYEDVDDLEKDILDEVAKGTNITKAVERAAQKNYISESTAWRRKRRNKKLTVK